MTQSRVEHSLLKLYDEEVEHVGFVLPHGKVVEVENISDEPSKSFDVSGADILKYEADAVGTWHTHPASSANLSAGDMETFLSWPDMVHYIVGNDGIRKYIVKDNEVLVD